MANKMLQLLLALFWLFVATIVFVLFCLLHCCRRRHAPSVGSRRAKEEDWHSPGAYTG